MSLPSANLVAQLVYAAVEKLRESRSEIVDPFTCIVADVMHGRAYRATRPSSRTFQDLTALCDTISMMWPALLARKLA